MQRDLNVLPESFHTAANNDFADDAARHRRSQEKIKKSSNIRIENFPFDIFFRRNMTQIGSGKHWLWKLKVVIMTKTAHSDATRRLFLAHHSIE